MHATMQQLIVAKYNGAMLHCVITTANSGTRIALLNGVTETKETI